MTLHELDDDQTAYLVYLILENVMLLQKEAPDHILVEAVTDALERVIPDDPNQLSFDF